MKKFLIITGFIAIVTGFVSCGAGGNDPGHAYMPDMYYSRAYETYGYNSVGGERDTLKNRGIFYNGLPVPGTMARGESMSYYLTSDSAGLIAANSLVNPLDTLAVTAGDLKEAERLYLINCGICHGTALDGNGPLLAGGGYIAVPAVLTAPNIAAFSDGHYFHVITFGIRTMGSYASQLTPEQRWWVIKYIRSKQGGETSDTTGTAPVGGDTTGIN